MWRPLVKPQTSVLPSFVEGRAAQSVVVFSPWGQEAGDLAASYRAFGHLHKASSPGFDVRASCAFRISNLIQILHALAACFGFRLDVNPECVCFPLRSHHTQTKIYVRSYDPSAIPMIALCQAPDYERPRGVCETRFASEHLRREGISTSAWPKPSSACLASSLPSKVSNDIPNAPRSKLHSG